MNFYSTPLQFGYFFALLFAVLFWWRGFREERLSDTLLGWVMFFLGMEIQDYTFGFAGINYLWEELEGFPRYFPWVFPASVYFYLKAQINRHFRFQKKDILHLVPYLIYVAVSLFYFVQGEAVVKAYLSSKLAHVLNYVYYGIIWLSYGYYFGKSLLLYQQYRAWAETQFSNTELVSFKWLRNFIYFIIAAQLFKWFWFGLSKILNLDFEEDWWWHLFTIGTIIYLAINGYSQSQPKIVYIPENKELETSDAPNKEASTEYLSWKNSLERSFVEGKLFLNPELSLSDLAQHLGSSPSVISAAINQNFNKNFNDFVNGYRIEAFKTALSKPEFKHYSFLGLALDCGFNSKATFNRAFKKHENCSPREFQLKQSV